MCPSQEAVLWGLALLTQTQNSWPLPGPPAATSGTCTLLLCTSDSYRAMEKQCCCLCPGQLTTAFGGCLRKDRDAPSFPLTSQTIPQFPFVSKTSSQLTFTFDLLAIQRIQTNFTATLEVPADVCLPKLKPDKCTRISWPVYGKKVLTDLG